MRVTLRIWRQKNASEPGRFVTYEKDNVSPDMSFLEMLDVLNRELTAKGEEPVAFEQRLPRRHLRHLFAGHRRRAARAWPRGGDLSAVHAQVHGRGHRRRGAVPGAGLSNHP